MKVVDISYARVQLLYEQSGLTGVLRGKTFENFEALPGKKQAINILQKWNVDQKGVFLFGPPGVGKTHLACALANRLIGEGVLVEYVSTVALPKHDADRMSQLSDGDAIPVLVLDDLGVEKMTDRTYECLHMILDGRLVSNGKLIVTSNYSVADVGTRLSERLSSRLLEACVEIAVAGKDFRCGI